MAFSLLGIAFVVVWRILDFRFMNHTARELPGWASAIAALLFLSGIQLLILGLIGEYIGRIYSEVKRRPRWILRDALGFPSALEERKNARVEV
jgi:dolichol-phosphate mannosyltransferase